MARSHTQDPATRYAGLKPTDHDLPIGDRTHVAPYLAAIVVVLVIGIALVAFAVVGFTESTSTLGTSADAVPPTDQLAPETTGSITQPRGAGAPLDREIQPSGAPDTAEPDPSIAVPGAD
jgi:hypothetical protein